MGLPFQHQLRVRYAECDMQGVVFNAQYLSFFDVSITELWRAAFGSYQAMLDHGVDLVVAAASVRFLRPARFDDRLAIEIAVAKLGTSSVSTSHRVRRGQSDIALGEMSHVFVDRDTLAKTPIPAWARDGLAPWVVEAS
ncbi:MAG: acyl-CoA thioesterase [Actinomycetota bacterium]|nr:acyl-CoA thioesterase [Actinomycetota bacterium]